MKKIALSTQKKFLFIPILNFMAIWCCANINKSYLMAKSIDFGMFKFELNILVRWFLIEIPFALLVVFVMYIRIPEALLISLLIIGMYVNTTVMSWSAIKYQKKLGIE